MKAFIFAAGYGKRLAPLTQTLPKPLVPVVGKPLIEHHIQRLKAIGVVEFVINCHWLAEKLKEHLGDGSRYGVQIRWSHEAQLLDTGGGLCQAIPMLMDEPFILVNGDVWTDYPFERLRELHLGNKLAHLVLVENPPHHPGGDFGFADSAGNCISADPQGALYTYAGMGLFAPGIMQYATASQSAFPLTDLLRPAIAVQKISAEVYSGDWEDVGTLERLQALEQRLFATYPDFS